MNYGILSRNVIVKCLTLVMVMLFSYDGAAQKYTYNVGNKIKLYWTDSFGDFPLEANIISSKDDALIVADKIVACGNGEMYSFSSSYGNYVEFQEIKERTLCPRLWSKKKGEEYYFVQNGSKLYLVKAVIDYKTTDKGVFDGYAVDEKMIGIVPFDLINIGDDFKIIMAIGFIHLDKIHVDISILNNGVLYEYDDDDIIKYSSVSSPKADVDNSKTYSIDGMQVETPHNGIFIKGNKKAFVK